MGGYFFFFMDVNYYKIHMECLHEYQLKFIKDYWDGLEQDKKELIELGYYKKLII